MKHAVLLAALTLMTTAGARADCAAQAGGARPRLVELYTSEGCSSCPPADRWLRGIAHDGADAALAFHVDYWDSLGWRDRFADARFTARQQQQAAWDGGTGIYTPQVVIDGRTRPGWYRGSPQAAAADATASLQMQVEGDAPLRIRLAAEFAPGADASGFRNFVALTEDALTSDVRAGENRGVLLRHDHVVRAFAGPLPLRGEAELSVPAGLDRGKARLVAFTQRRSDGALAQVLDCAL